MKRIGLIAIIGATLLSSCVSKKKFTELSTLEEEARTQLRDCIDEKTRMSEQVNALEGKNQVLQDQVTSLNNTNEQLLSNMNNLTTLSSEGAKTLEKSLESMKEKDLEIKYLRDAVTQRDSITLALVTSIKGVLGNMQDEDIEVNVEKGVVYIAIADKLLFSSGSYKVNEGAKSVLGKVAKIVNDKPDLEFMVEGHTDSIPISRDLITDNWDLSVLRAAAIVRFMQNEMDVAPERMTAAGRSYYMPKADNSTPEGRAKNRRTRIVILPKLDQFYSMVEDGMEEAEKNEQEE